MKHTVVGVATASRQWRHHNVDTNRVPLYLPNEAGMALNDEFLCADPEGALGKIATFLGAPRTPISVLGERVHHIIGNSMRLRALSEIREDRWWQIDPLPRDLALIARIAGRTSRRLGFGWP